MPVEEVDETGGSVDPAERVAAELEAWLATQQPPVRINGSRDADLFQAGLMDSLLVVLMVQYLEGRYRIAIPEESMGTEPLATVGRIAQLVVNLQAQSGTPEAR